MLVIAVHTLPFDIDKVARRYAPLVRFHPDELFFPSSVDWYLPRVELWHQASQLQARRSTVLTQILKRGEVNPLSLVTQQAGEDRSSGSQPSGHGLFCLNIPNSEEARATRRGDLSTARCYVHWQQPERGVVWLVYWFFYPYNGSISKVISSAHGGDWEHIRVEINQDSERVNRIYMSAHQGGRWYSRYSTGIPGRVGFRNYNRTRHPIVYSARYSHASYPTSGRQKRRLLGIDPLMPDDITGCGIEWPIWESLELLGDQAHPLVGQEWLQYNGHWGRTWGSLLNLHGPLGPAFRDWWRDASFAS